MKARSVVFLESSKSEKVYAPSLPLLISIQHYAKLDCIITGPTVYDWQYVRFSCTDFGAISHYIQLHKHGLTLIPAWISNHMPSKVWDEINYPFPNFSGTPLKFGNR